MGTKSRRSSGSQHNMRGVAQGNTLVDPITGLPVDVIEDDQGTLRLAVDTIISADGIGVDVDLDPLEDGVHIGDINTGDTLLVNPDGSINVNTRVDAADGDNISISAHLNPIFDEGAGTITTSAFNQVYIYTSLDNDTRITSMEVTADTPCIFALKLNGTTIKTKRSSSLEKNVTFEFSEHRPLASGDILTVEARADRFRRPVYNTFVSLEGYLI